MNIAPEELYTLGNLALLQQPKTTFFCSREYPASIEEPTYQWAQAQRERKRCIFSAFHSQLEQKMLRYLLHEPEQPVIYALGRGIQPNLRLQYGPELKAGNLLVLTIFEPDVRTITSETAEIRNLLLADLSDEFFIPYLTPGGRIDQLLDQPAAQGKPIITLDIPENEPLLRRGAQVWRETVE